MEEFYKISTETEGKAGVSIDASPDPNNIKKLLERLADGGIDTIAFKFKRGIEIDFLLMQAMAILRKNGKKISIDGEAENSKVMNQILQNIII